MVNVPPLTVMGLRVTLPERPPRPDKPPGLRRPLKVTGVEATGG